MALLSAHRGGRALVSGMLAAMIAIAAVPIVYAAAGGGGRCSITLDICHPAQSISSSPAPMLAPPPAGPRDFGVSPLDRESPDVFALAHADRIADAPDPPPPKPLP